MTLVVEDSVGDDAVARVYMASIRGKGHIEFVESTPTGNREEKWVLILSTMLGCPVGCPMCDAGGDYRGALSREEILDQIDYMVERRYGKGMIDVEKFKIQFARMGEPALNDEVLEALNELPKRYDSPGLAVSLSTIAPRGRDDFFSELLRIKDSLYRGKFQLQFSVHATDEKDRDILIPCSKWSFREIAEYGEKFKGDDDKKITLNFISFRHAAIDPGILRNHFDPSVFLIKITPLNPTLNMSRNGLESGFDPEDPSSVNGLISDLRSAGYDVILSIGDLEENKIGSNCGQFLNEIDKKYG